MIYRVGEVIWHELGQYNCGISRRAPQRLQPETGTLRAETVEAPRSLERPQSVLWDRQQIRGCDRDGERPPSVLHGTVSSEWDRCDRREASQGFGKWPSFQREHHGYEQREVVLGGFVMHSHLRNLDVRYRFRADAIPRVRGQSKDEIMNELLSHGTEMVDIDLVMMDREFDSEAVKDTCEEYGVHLWKICWLNKPPLTI